MSDWFHWIVWSLICVNLCEYSKHLLFWHCKSWNLVKALCVEMVQGRKTFGESWCSKLYSNLFVIIDIIKGLNNTSMTIAYKFWMKNLPRFVAGIHFGCDLNCDVFIFLNEGKLFFLELLCPIESYNVLALYTLTSKLPGRLIVKPSLPRFVSGPDLNIVSVPISRCMYLTLLSCHHVICYFQCHIMEY